MDQLNLSPPLSPPSYIGNNQNTLTAPSSMISSDLHQSAINVLAHKFNPRGKIFTNYLLFSIKIKGHTRIIQMGNSEKKIFKYYLKI